MPSVGAPATPPPAISKDVHIAVIQGRETPQMPGRSGLSVRTVRAMCMWKVWCQPVMPGVVPVPCMAWVGPAGGPAGVCVPMAHVWVASRHSSVWQGTDVARDPEATT